jgi:hypothetical protein
LFVFLSFLVFARAAARRESETRVTAAPAVVSNEWQKNYFNITNRATDTTDAVHQFFEYMTTPRPAAACLNRHFEMSA